MRAIAHVDMDCYYAQVERERFPAWRELPIGVVQKASLCVTCNYRARQRGVVKTAAALLARQLVVHTLHTLHPSTPPRLHTQTATAFANSFSIPPHRPPPLAARDAVRRQLHAALQGCLSAMVQGDELFQTRHGPEKDEAFLDLTEAAHALIRAHVRARSSSKGQAEGGTPLAAAEAGATGSVIGCVTADPTPERLAAAIAARQAVARQALTRHLQGGGLDESVGSLEMARRTSFKPDPVSIRRQAEATAKNKARMNQRTTLRGDGEGAGGSAALGSFLDASGLYKPLAPVTAATELKDVPPIKWPTHYKPEQRALAKRRWFAAAQLGAAECQRRARALHPIDFCRMQPDHAAPHAIGPLPPPQCSPAPAAPSPSGFFPSSPSSARRSSASCSSSLAATAAAAVGLSPCRRRGGRFTHWVGSVLHGDGGPRVTSPPHPHPHPPAHGVNAPHASQARPIADPDAADAAAAASAPLSAASSLSEPPPVCFDDLGPGDEPTHEQLLCAASQILFQIRSQIFIQLGFTTSGALAPNPMLAKMCSARHKPNQQTVLLPSGAHTFLQPCRLQDIPGCGPVLLKRLKQKGFETIAHVQRCVWPDLKAKAGSDALSLQRMAAGEDPTPVEASRGCPDKVGKSIQENPVTTLRDKEELLRYLSKELHERQAEDECDYKRRPTRLELSWCERRKDGGKEKVGWGVAGSGGVKTRGAELPSTMWAHQGVEGREQAYFAVARRLLTAHVSERVECLTMGVSITGFVALQGNNLKSYFSASSSSSSSCSSPAAPSPSSTSSSAHLLPANTVAPNSSLLVPANSRSAQGFFNVSNVKPAHQQPSSTSSSSAIDLLEDGHSFVCGVCSRRFEESEREEHKNWHAAKLLAKTMEGEERRRRDAALRGSQRGKGKGKAKRGMGGSKDGTASKSKRHKQLDHGSGIAGFFKPKSPAG